MSSFFAEADRLRKSGEHKKAVEKYNSYIKFHGESKLALINLSASLIALKEYKTALISIVKSYKIDKKWIPEEIVNVFICISELRPSFAQKLVIKAVSYLPDKCDTYANKILNKSLNKGFVSEVYLAADAYQKRAENEITFLAIKYKACGLAADYINKKKLEINLKEIYEISAEIEAMCEDPYTHLLWSKNSEIIKKNIKSFIHTSLPKEIESRGGGYNCVASKIKIGYLSSDFYGHATMHLMIEMLESHNSEEFDITLIDHSPSINDSYRNRLEKIGCKILKINEFQESEKISEIKKLKLDVLIDLKGYTKDNLLSLFSNRLAKLQGSFLGFPGPILYKGCDFNIVDKHVMTTEQEKIYGEKYIYLNCYQPNCSDRIRSNFKRNYQGALKICNLNNIQKINFDDIIHWGRFVNSLNSSFGSIEFSIINPGPIGKSQIAKILKKILTKEITLNFLDKLGADDHLNRIGQFHIALDCLVYGGHTTSSELIWANVPVLTIPGNTFQSRVSYSLLKNIGMDELIFDCENNMYDFAKTLTFEKLKTLSTKLFNASNTSLVFDGKAFSAEFESKIKEFLMDNLKK